jgi:hypothetical protein
LNEANPKQTDLENRAMRVTNIGARPPPAGIGEGVGAVCPVEVPGREPGHADSASISYKALSTKTKSSGNQGARSSKRASSGGQIQARSYSGLFVVPQIYIPSKSSRCSRMSMRGCVLIARSLSLLITLFSVPCFLYHSLFSAPRDFIAAHSLPPGRRYGHGPDDGSDERKVVAAVTAAGCAGGFRDVSSPGLGLEAPLRAVEADSLSTTKSPLKRPTTSSQQERSL